MKVIRNKVCLKSIVAIAGLIITMYQAKSQQVPLLTFGFESPHLYNPSVVAFNTGLNATLQYRQQWVGIQGAPETFVFSINGKPASNMGIGLTVYNDQTDIIGQMGFVGSYAYKFNFLDDHALSFGLSAQIIRNQIWYDKINVNNPEEQMLLNYNQKATSADAGFGLRYVFKDKFFLNISATNLMRAKFTFEEQASFKENRFQLMTHYFISSGYKFKFNGGKYVVEPWLNLRSVQGTPLQYEANASFLWNDLLKLTSGYRQGDGMYAAIQLRLFESISVGFAHDFSNKYIRSVSSGTNEIMLSFQLSGRSQTIREGVAARDLKTIKRQTQEQFQEIERLQQENERLVKQQAMNDSLVKNQKIEIEKLKEIFAKDKEVVERVKEKYIIKETEIDSIVASNKEDKKSIYVIVGAYLTLADAKFFQKILEREIGLQTLVFEREDGSYYFVYTRQVKSREEADREYRRLKRLNIDLYINGNIWLYGEK